MQAFSASWRRLDHRFLALNTRERVLVLLALLAVLIAAAQLLFFAPLQQQLRTEKNLQTDIQRRHEQLENELSQLQAWQTKQEDGSQLVSVQQQLDSIDQQIGQLSQRMVPPEQMTALLQQLLAREQGMQVLALEKLPLTSATEDADSDANAGAETTAASSSETDGELPLYRHRLRLSLRGSYFDSLRYLQAMEALPWTVYWDSLDYQVEDYPQGVLTIEIATLGQEKGWLGG